MSDPLAYFLTWTTHGTWLHGDPRGSVACGDNVPNTPYLPPNPQRQEDETHRLDQPAVTLNSQARQIVHATILAHCAHRGWTPVALNVRSNHVHTVIENAGVPPEQMLGQFKSWATRRLREAGLFDPHTTIWTHHGSTRYLWKRESVLQAVEYVTDGQGPDLD